MRSTDLLYYLRRTARSWSPSMVSRSQHARQVPFCATCIEVVRIIPSTKPIKPVGQNNEIVNWAVPVAYFGLLIAERSFCNGFAESELAGASCNGPGISRVCMHAARHSSLGRHVAASEYHTVTRRTTTTQPCTLYRIRSDSTAFPK